MAKTIFRILTIVLICVSTVLIINLFIKAFPVKYWYLLLIFVLIFVGGQMLFHSIIKKKFQDNPPMIKTLDFIFSIIWWGLLFYLLFHIPFSRDFPAK
jgi:disulfide bond formation protein DsbB